MEICRTCGPSDKITSNVKISNYIVENGNNIKISDLLYTLTSIKFSEENNLPKNICIKCTEKLIQTLCFINKCKQTNELFIRKFTQNEIKVTDKTIIDKINEKEKCESIDSNLLGRKFMLKIVDSKKFNCTHSNPGEKKKILLSPHGSCDDSKKKSNELNENVTENKDILSGTDDVQHLESDNRNSEHNSKHCKKTKNNFYPIKVIKNKFDLRIDNNIKSKIDNSSKRKIENLKDANILNQINIELKDVNEMGRKAESIIKTDSSEKLLKIASDETILENAELANIRPFKCNVCFLSFKSSKELYIHSKRKHNKPCLFYKCDYIGCKFVFNTYKKYQAHLKIHQKTKISYVCNVCQKVFKFLSSFIKHYEAHFDSNPKEYICNFCNKKLANASSLCVHLRRHNKAYKAICQVCGKGYVTPSDLKTHMIFHSKEKMYQCEYCGKRFQTSYNLQYHKKSQHLKTGSLACSLCPKTFYTKTHLNYHFRRVHAKNEHKFLCQICEKKFFTGKELQIHTMVHYGERPLKCTKCPKTYTRAYLLKKHMDRHSNSFAQCDVCLCFMKPQFVERHKRRHENKNSSKHVEETLDDNDENGALEEIVLSGGLDDFCQNITVKTEL